MAAFLPTGMSMGAGTGNGKNVIWVFADQHRAQAMGHRGDPNARTPNLDALAGESVEFVNAYSNCPWSSPFRGSLLTGQYANNAVFKTPQHLDPSLPLVTDEFNRANYTTAFFGKWHLYGFNEMVFVPRAERGRFGTWVGYENNNAPFDTWVHGHDLWGRNDTVAKAEKLPKFETDALIDKAIDFLRRRPRNKPFFLVVSFQPPHNPYIAPAEYMSHFSEDSIVLRPNVPPIERLRKEACKTLAGYYALIENVDYNIGRLYAAMRELGLLNNTDLVYFADHGDCHQSHGYIYKSSPWEEAARIPCIFRPAGGIRGGRESAVMFNTIDFAPTTLGSCGLAVPKWMPGYDYSGELTRTPPATDPNRPDALLLQHIYPKGSDCLDRPWRAVVTREGWKYVVVANQPIMLFDLSEDPYELNNLVYLPQYKKTRAKLAAKLRDLLAKAGDDFTVAE